MSSGVYQAFGGVALLGLVGFVFAWVTAPAKTPTPAQRTKSLCLCLGHSPRQDPDTCSAHEIRLHCISEPPNKRLKLPGARSLSAIR